MFNLENISWDNIAKLLSTDKEFKKKQKEAVKKAEASYDNLLTFIAIKEEELKREIEANRERIIEELAKSEVVARNFRKTIETEYLLEVHSRIKGLLNTIEEIEEAQRRMKNQRDFWIKVAFISMMFSVFTIGAIVGFVASNWKKFFGKGEVVKVEKASKESSGKGYLNIPLKRGD